MVFCILIFKQDPPFFLKFRFLSNPFSKTGSGSDLSRRNPQEPQPCLVVGIGHVALEP